MRRIDARFFREQTGLSGPGDYGEAKSGNAEGPLVLRMVLRGVVPSREAP